MEIVWAYKKVETRIGNPITVVEVAKSIVIFDRKWRRVTIGAGEVGGWKELNRFLEDVGRHAPWAFLGYSKEIAKANWDTVVAQVTARRRLLGEDSRPPRPPGTEV